MLRLRLRSWPCVIPVVCSVLLIFTLIRYNIFPGPSLVRFGDQFHKDSHAKVAAPATTDSGRQDINNVSKWDGYTGALVVSRGRNAQTAWIGATEFYHKWLPIVYSNNAKYAGEQSLTLPKNKGREAMAYLTFIIDNYASLPPYAIFSHGHRKSWHQNMDINDILKLVNLTAVEERGYISLRCDWHPSCPAELKLRSHDGVAWGQADHRQEVEDIISGEVWHHFFPEVEMPDTLASQCCAQFFVSRAAILRHPLDTYLRIRQWILDTNVSDYVSGRVLEKLWAYIFTGNAVNCPSPQTCACQFFGNCHKQKWREPPPELGRLPEDSRWEG